MRDDGGPLELSCRTKQCRWGLSGTPPVGNIQSIKQVAAILWYEEEFATQEDGEPSKRTAQTLKKIEEHSYTYVQGFSSVSQDSQPLSPRLIVV